MIHRNQMSHAFRNLSKHFQKPSNRLAGGEKPGMMVFLWENIQIVKHIQ
jgi:hypothetical protein